VGFPIPSRRMSDDLNHRRLGQPRVTAAPAPSLTQLSPYEHLERGYTASSRHWGRYVLQVERERQIGSIVRTRSTCAMHTILGLKRRRAEGAGDSWHPVFELHRGVNITSANRNLLLACGSRGHDVVVIHELTNQVGVGAGHASDSTAEF